MNVNIKNTQSTSVIVNKKDTMDKRDLGRLLDYYRMRVESFEKERIEWLEKLEGIRLSQEEHHKLEWELRRRIDEVKELQNCLNESNIALNGERKHILHLNAELENAKLKSREDRRRLIQLLQLAEPIEQTIKLYYDRRPEKMEKYVNGITAGIKNNLGNFSDDSESLALSRALGITLPLTDKTNYSSTNSISNMKRNNSLNKLNQTTCKSCHKSKKCGKCRIIQNKENLSSPRLEYRIPTSDEKQQVVRTILLPNETTDVSLKEEKEYLRTQLINLKNFYENHILKMEEDRRLREEEIRLIDLNSKEKIEDLIKKNQKLERLNYESTKDYMQLKYDSSNVEKKLYEEIELLKLQNEALSISLKEITSKTSLDKEFNKNDYERKTREITNVMRSQVKSHEENINIIKEQYKQIQKIYTTRVKELENKLKQLTDKYKNLENRRNNEIEGYINEINLMRKRMKSYEDYAMKLKRFSQGMEEGEGFDVAGTTDKFLHKSQKTRGELDNLEDRLRDDYNYNYSEQNNDNSDIGVKNESNQNYTDRNEEESGVAVEDL